MDMCLYEPEKSHTTRKQWMETRKKTALLFKCKDGFF